MVQVQKGAVKFNSIMDMAKSHAAKSGEPVQRVYIRLWKRMKHGMNASKAFHNKPRKYTRKAKPVLLLTYQPQV